jgi:NAD(P)-dependent dehydrogenase (short-subunit alcohol dehydrogenase family)
MQNDIVQPSEAQRAWMKLGFGLFIHFGPNTFAGAAWGDGRFPASQFALEGYTEALRLEVKPFNIHVSLIETGFIKTPMMDHRQVVAERIREYDPWRQRAFKAIRNYEEKGPSPELVAKTVLKIITSKTPRLRYVIGQQAKSVSRFRQFLPEGVFEQGVRSFFGLDKNQ